MSLTQMQLIQSLGDALAWLEREITWGVPPTELRHLCGRIGELYACVVTNGQMAQAVNEKGYDVRAKSGERISVKTTAMMGTAGHVTFNPKTLAFVDRVMVLRVNSEEREVEILFDAPLETARPLMKANGNGGLDLALSKLQKTQSEPKTDIPVVRQGKEGQYEVRELENGSIEISIDGVPHSPVKPKLRELAMAMSLPLGNANGNPYNTRQLGGVVLDAMLGKQFRNGMGRGAMRIRKKRVHQLTPNPGQS